MIMDTCCCSMLGVQEILVWIGFRHSGQSTQAFSKPNVSGRRTLRAFPWVSILEVDEGSATRGGSSER